MCKFGLEIIDIHAGTITLVYPVNLGGEGACYVWEAYVIKWNRENEL